MNNITNTILNCNKIKNVIISNTILITSLVIKLKINNLITIEILKTFSEPSYSKPIFILSFLQEKLNSLPLKIDFKTFKKPYT